MGGVPTTTLTQRPWTVYITLGVSLVCAGVLAAVHLMSNYTTAQTTLDRLFSTLGKGDVDTLLSDPELGFEERAQKDIRQRGLEEYNKIMAAFSTCATAGQERYRALKQTVLLRGDEAFKKLSADEQKKIRQKSRDQWIVEAGLGALGKEACGGIEDPAVLGDPLAAEPLLVPMGLARLEKAGEKGLPSATEMAAWNKPTKQQKEILERVRAAGEAAIADVSENVLATGNKLFKGLPARERKQIAGLSHQMWVIEKGMELLDEEDRLLVTGPEMFLDDADEEKESRILCLAIMPPAKKALIEGRDYEDFAAKREDYIGSTGKERYQHFLEVLFAGCDYEVVETTLSGNDPYDLLRISRATYVLRYRGCPGAAEYLGDTFVFEFDGRSWRYKPEASRPPLAPQAGGAVIPPQDAGGAQ